MAKILVVAPTPFFSNRGTHIRILEEALALEKMGHEITIVTYHIGENIDRRISTHIDVRRILRLLFWYKKLEAGPDWQKILLDLMLIRKTFFLARTKRPDVIHGHLHEGVIIGWIVKKLLFWRKMKLVADFHGSLTGEMHSHGYLKAWGLGSIFKLVERMINQMGDWAITSSWECTDSIKKSRRDGRVETVLDGTNIDSFRITRSKDEIKDEWEIPKDKFIVSYTGGLVANKGLSYLLEAIPLVLKEEKNTFFLIGGFPREHAEKFIEEHELEDHVRLIVPLDYFKLPEFLHISDVAVDPKGTVTHQASGKMLNYMAAGLPIVCFDKENNHKYLGSGGRFCSQESPEGLAQGILSIIKNPQLGQEEGRINRKSAERFSWMISAKRISDIYEILISNKH